jgi:2-polyprenyl-6-methoxyphenol hydroxylase-like FAD-dependent oxidoreductase
MLQQPPHARWSRRHALEYQSAREHETSVGYSSSMTDVPVLIAGAGPTGLVLALWLTRSGVKVRLIDKVAEPGTTSRALAVQARTLEFYRQLGFAQEVVDCGLQVPALNMWVKGRRVASVPLQLMGHGLSPFDFALVFPQDEHERFLIAKLHELGVAVEREVELLGFEDDGQQIRATLARGDGSQETCTASYIAGCDGARSKTREVLGVGFPGGTYDHLFYVADVEATGAPMNGELHVALDEADFLAVFPLKGAGRARLVGSIRDGAVKDAAQLKFEDIQQDAIKHLLIEVQKVNWFSTYHVHHRVAHAFAKGRAFLLGDAAHVHSPVGGQGMNTGIGDAVNLAWKLASVLNAGSSPLLLDSYETERIGFARRLVATTDRLFAGVINPSSTARFVRTKMVPELAPPILRLGAVRRFMFRTVSQIAINYRGSALSAGSAGAVHGGDRLPWVPGAVTGGNFAPLASLKWQVHVYGAPNAALADFCASRKLEFHQFPWQATCEAAGLVQNALYLVRPDGYVALAEPLASTFKLEEYFQARALRA